IECAKQVDLHYLAKRGRVELGKRGRRYIDARVGDYAIGHGTEVACHILEDFSDGFRVADVDGVGFAAVIKRLGRRLRYIGPCHIEAVFQKTVHTCSSDAAGASKY